ncbi:MAG: carboxypeptidase-like regulatory domain-containing protein [Actinomycetota bacterium]
MRLVKAALGAAIVFGLVSMWSNRAVVVDAYRTETDPPQIRLSGVDLAVARTEIDPSPFAIPAAPDTRAHVPPVLAFAEVDDPVPAVTLDGGRAALSGTVAGPDGPIAEAIVAVERHTAAGTATRRLTTDEDGTWRTTGLVGGRYRVRAWVPAALTMGTSAVLFLADDGRETFDFELWGIDPEPFLDFVHSGELYHESPGTVAAVVSRRIIDDDGVVVTVPVTGAPVTIQVTPQLAVLSATSQVTGEDGAARFAVVCPPPGATPADGLVVGAAQVGPDAPAIVAPADPVDPIESGRAEPAGEPTSDTGDSSEPVDTGTAVIRSGTLVGAFALPACVPVPPPEPEGDPVEGATDG